MASKPTSLSSFDFARVVGEAHTVIRVRNLQCTASVGTDAWGRPNAIQPILISATVVLKDEFESAAQSDQVNNSTVHYGILSKALLKGAQDFLSSTQEHTLDHFTSWLYENLLSSKFKCHGLVFDKDVPEQVLDISVVKAVEITVHLPKASLLGAGVSYTSAYADFTDEKHIMEISCRSKRTSLKIHDLDIPTLVGVNAIERGAKQRVVTNVEIDLFTFNEDTSNSYAELEQLVVKTIEESSFETLESLAEYLSRRIIYYYIFPTIMGVGPDGTYSERASELLQKSPRFPEWQRIKISLEKPTAVTFADAPAIEIIRPSAPTANKTNMELWNQFGRLRPPKVPFPLLGSIEEWIKQNPS